MWMDEWSDNELRGSNSINTLDQSDGQQISELYLKVRAIGAPTNTPMLKVRKGYLA